MSINELLTATELGIIYAIAAMGIFLTFRTIDFQDLTCDGSFVLGAAVSAIYISSGGNPYLALLLGLFAGALAGIATGILYTYFKIADLLAGILIAFMLYSVNLKVMGGLPNISIEPLNTVFNNHSVLIVLIISCFIVWSAIGYLLSTNLGLALRSLGQNKQLSRIGGVNIISGTFLGLGLSNGLIGLSGALFSQHQGFADISQGIGTIIVGLAAVMLGEKLLPSRNPKFMLLACIVGSVLYRMFIGVALHSEILGLQAQDLNLLTGALIIAVMLLPRRKLC